ncbi:coiled-coil domain-containing protein 81 [Callorhinchus milii]|uniref:coiled-coil domain-containing protein 81 n=1 Tax=Callorhinchus milii TaxID=7868 RepID=UPI000457437D|nr:coiled-coil domain-containing protein 81 [Callorhinchus milii]|eukprot:gi/632937981/ref/XP_007901782.1/ PREDICTED: coiled-coil domain-containing protein 81 [Callorhinchus milii]
MLETIQSAVLEVGENLFPTLPKLSADDVVNVWANVAGFTDRQMSLQKGVHIPNLGTFTFSQQKLDMGHKQILMQRPVFLMSEKNVQDHGLTYTKQHVSDDIPIVPLNFTAISLESPFDRDTVEGCVKETLQIMYRYISLKRNVEFIFKDIGVLTIRNNKVKMKFYKDFLNAMDGSGYLVKALSNRPVTEDSVISMKDSSEFRATPNTVVFPCIQSNEVNDQKLSMETINEEDRENNEGMYKAQHNETTRENEQTEKLKEEKNKETAEASHAKQTPLRKSMTPAIASAISLTEEFEKSDDPKAPSERLPPQSHLSSPQCGIQHTNSSSSKLKTPTTPANSCPDHCRAGQELCYLCMQRALRNVPVDMSEEKRRRQEEEEQILQQYQQMKDQDALFKHQCEMLASREYNQKISAFNMGVAEAIKRQKNSKCKEYHKGYIFQKRPFTPPILLGQEKYSQCLKKQLEDKNESDNKKKQDEEFLDRLEQVQLAEDLAAQREQYLKEKQEQADIYKRALDAQVKNKAFQLPAYEPDSAEPIFGQNEMTYEKELEKRQQAHELYKQQLGAVVERKRNAILNQMYEQKKELEMLDRNKKDLIAEHRRQYANLCRMHKALEEAWSDSANLKRLKDYEETQYTKAGGLFLLDQCNKYRRCYQCQRRTSGCEETNVWNNSRFID